MFKFDIKDLYELKKEFNYALGHMHSNLNLI